MIGTQGDLLAAEAITRVAANADEAWMKAARHALWRLIQAERQFTSDEVWQLLDETGVDRPHEARAMGAVFRAALRAGYIKRTGDYRKTVRPEAHSRPIPVWEPVRKASAA